MNILKNSIINYDNNAAYLKGLNEEQLKAVLHEDGPLLILAGAGSGKTRVITLRAVHLIKTGMAKPYNILGVTFTNKAAREMKERIKKALAYTEPYGISAHGPGVNGGYSAGLPEFSTFHSFCLKLLRRHADLIGYNKSFVVFDDDDSGKIISKIIKSFNINEKIITPSKVKYFIEKNKNSYINSEEAFGTVRAWEKDYAAIYAEYTKKLKENNAMDFNDLIFNAVKLFGENPTVLEHYSNLYRYIMVDEFQDTNYIQDKLIKLLADKHKNICVVGDDDQSIYSFRGATIDNILSFEKTYAGCSVIKLEKNYRSTKNILSAASALVKGNKLRKDKTLRTDKKGGGSIITIYRANNDYSESYYIAKEIRRLIREDGYSNIDIAILYRANSQSRVIEDRLIRESIRYNIYGGLKFYQRKEIKDILSFLRFAINPKDAVSFERSIQCVPTGAGEKTIKNMADIAYENGVDILTALKSGLFASIRGLNKTAAALQASGNSAIAKYFDLILKIKSDIESEMRGNSVEVDKIKAESGEENSSGNAGESKGGHESVSGSGDKLADIINYVYKASGYESMLKVGVSKANELDQNRIENIEELINASHEFGNISEFLDQSAINDTKEEPSGKDGSRGNDITKVSLMTLHSSKGLEFPVVFIAGLEEHLFPHIRSLDNELSIEEERRLCYVGITRAKEKLYLTWSKKRRSGKDYKYNMPSRFLKEIPEELIEEIVDTYEYY
jgi:DNA helicase-2/ATP-dependent DNA helicase PcrA